MITPIFIPMSTGSIGNPTPFELYQIISGVITFCIVCDISLTLGFGGLFIALLISLFFGWFLLPVIVLLFIIFCIIAVIRG